MTAAVPPPVPGTVEQVLPTPDGPLHLLCAGRTGPVVLLLSGAGVDSASLSWRHLLPALAPSHRVVAVDWPKQGASRPWRGRATHAVLLDCVARVIDHAGVDRAQLVGLSQGGAIALATATERPDRVDRLVGIAPAGTLSFPPVIHQVLWLTARSRLLNTVLPTWLLGSRERVRRFVRAGLFAGPATDEESVIDEILAEVGRRGSSGATSSDWQNDSIGPWRMRVDLRGDLHRITAPTLLIQGDRDRGVPLRRTRAVAALIPGARLVVLPGHGHWPNRQSPERVNRLIGDFLAGRAVVDPGPDGSS